MRFMWSSMAVAVFAGSMLAVPAKRVQAQDATLLPAAGGPITVVGCLQRGGKHDKLVLARPTAEAIASVSEPTCGMTGADRTETLVELKDTHTHHLTDAMIGQWVEVSGRLEKLEKSDEADDSRELHVRGYKAVPVVITRTVEVEKIRPAAPPEAVAPISLPAPEAKPVVTSGVLTTAPVLPNTASFLPLIGSLGLMSLGGGLGVRMFRLRRRARD